MKNLLMNLSVIFITGLLSNQVFAASKINYLNVDGDVVHFSLAEAKSHTIPSCVAAETTDRYAVLLTNEAGRAMYSLLITAMASKQAITVESANDCADVTGVERPKGLSIVPIATATNGGGKSIYLYKGDGVTKLGRILNTTDNINTFWYFPVDDNTQVLRYDNRNWLTLVENSALYFNQAGCTGTAYYPSSQMNYVKNNYFNNGKLLRKTNSNHIFHRSILYGNGNCVELMEGQTRSYYSMEPYTDPLCGDSACIFKEE